MRFAFHLEESLRETERRGTLQTAEGRLKMIAVAVHTYHDVWKKLPAATVRDKDGKPLLSWRVTLLPQLGHLDVRWIPDFIAAREPLNCQRPHFRAPLADAAGKDHGVQPTTVRRRIVNLWTCGREHEKSTFA